MTIDQLLESVIKVGLPSVLCVGFLFVAYKIGTKLTDAHIKYIDILSVAQESQARSLKILVKCYRKLTKHIETIEEDGCGNKSKD